MAVHFFFFLLSTCVVGYSDVILSCFLVSWKEFAVPTSYVGLSICMYTTLF